LIFLDYNAGAPPDPRLREVLAGFPPEIHANPASPHSAGRTARRYLEEARERIAASLGIEPLEVCFVSGGTEANNLAVRCGFGWAEEEGAVALRSLQEHPSVRVPFDHEAARSGVGVRDLAVDARGFQALPGEWEGGPAFLSLIYGQNETGVCQEALELCRRVRKAGGLVHRDASQALGRAPLSAVLAEADYLTLSPHKAGGPKGIGLLILREGRPFHPLLRGGEQEFGRRPGTPCALAAQAAAFTVEWALEEWRDRASRMSAALAAFEEGLPPAGWRRVPEPVEGARLPNTLSFRVEGVAARDLLPALDVEGVALSHGSACSSGAREPSRVLRALGLSRGEAASCLRVSVGPELGCELAKRAGLLCSQVLARFR